MVSPSLFDMVNLSLDTVCYLNPSDACQMFRASQSTTVVVVLIVWLVGCVDREMIWVLCMFFNQPGSTTSKSGVKGAGENSSLENDNNNHNNNQISDTVCDL